MLAKVTLRELLPADFELLYQWENNPENWDVSETKKPFSKQEIKDFVNQEQNIKKHLQQRFMICLNDIPIGCIDLFEYNSLLNKAGVGVLIADKENRNKGYAELALNLLINKCRNELSIVYLFCNIFKDNTASICLFEKCGFLFVEERMLDGKCVNFYEMRFNND